jgi:hypothetical protein
MATPTSEGPGWVVLIGGPCAGRWVREPGSFGFLGPRTELWASESAEGHRPPRRWYRYVYDEAGGVWSWAAGVRTALPRGDWVGERRVV